MFLALILGVGSVLLLSGSLRAETVILKQGENPWLVHKRFTDKGNDFRYSEYRRANFKTGRTRVLFKNETGKVTLKQLAMFKRLQPGDEIIIPDNLTKYTQMVVGGKSVVEICKPTTNAALCENVVAEKNYIKNTTLPLPVNWILVPKEFASAILKPPAPKALPLADAPVSIMTGPQPPATPVDLSGATRLLLLIGTLGILTLLFVLRHRIF